MDEYFHEVIVKYTQNRSSVHGEQHSIHDDEVHNRLLGNVEDDSVLLAFDQVVLWYEGDEGGKWYVPGVG